MTMNHAERVQRLTHGELVALWETIAAGDMLSDWPDGKAFEHLILAAFKLEGADVRWPYSVSLPFVRADGVGDSDLSMEQIDGAIYVDNLFVLVEAKDHGKNIDIGPVAKLRSQLARRPALAIGVVFSRKGFTLPAKMLAQFVFPQTVLLWEGRDFERALRAKKLCVVLRQKFRHAVEHALPDYVLPEGDEWS